MQQMKASAIILLRWEMKFIGLDSQYSKNPTEANLHKAPYTM
jgi:hypothetical protein